MALDYGIRKLLFCILTSLKKEANIMNKLNYLLSSNYYVTNNNEIYLYMFFLIFCTNFLLLFTYFFILKIKHRTIQSYLNQAFYELLALNSGKISVVEFAEVTDISVESAVDFISEKASKYEAISDIDDDGNIRYYFHKIH